MATSRAELIKGRLAHTRRDLDAVINHITPEMLSWAPFEGMRTVAGQFVEIIECEVPLISHLGGKDEPTESEMAALVGDSNDFENLKRKLVAVRNATLATLDSFSEEELEEEIDYGDAWFGSFWKERLPRAELFLNAAEHEAYHVGQLISYVWSRGDNPYEW